MTLEQINLLTVADCEDILYNRLYARDAEIIANLAPDETYVILPEELEAELRIYKDELMDIENERLRIQALKERIDAMKDANHAHAILHSEIPNAALFRKQKILDNKDHAEAESILAELEAKDAEIRAAQDATAYIELRKNEYPSIESCMHVILDHGVDSPEFAALQAQRNSIKAKYQKQ